MTGEGSTQDWDAYPPGAYVPPAPPVPPQGQWPAYGSPPGYPPPGFGTPGFGPPPGYGPPAYGPPPGYGPPAYGPPPGYGPAAYWASAPLPWPHGPARPGAALTAAVLGFVTGGLTILVSLIVLLAVIDGEDDASTVLMLLGLPCAVAVIAGAAVLIRRGSPRVLFVGALASVGVLLLVGIVGAATQDTDTVIGMVLFGVFALPLPILTAVFARLPQVRGWAADG